MEVLLESIPLIGPVKYLVQVSSKLNAASWGRLRRYREFDALHRELLSLEHPVPADAPILFKPFSPQELFQAVDMALAEKLGNGT